MNNKIKQESNYVRVIGNTMAPEAERMNKMIGKVYEVQENGWHNDTVIIDGWQFNKKDVQFLTNAEFEGKEVCIGDEVEWCSEWYKVIGFCEFDNKPQLSMGTPDDTYEIFESNITAHRTPQAPQQMTLKEVCKELNREIIIKKD